MGGFGSLLPALPQDISDLQIYCSQRFHRWSWKSVQRVKGQTGDKRLWSPCHLQAVSILLTISENQFFRWPISFCGSPVTCSWQQPDHISDQNVSLCSLRQVYDVACISLGPCGHEDTALCRKCQPPMRHSQFEYEVDGWRLLGCRIGLGSSAKNPLIYRRWFSGLTLGHWNSLETFACQCWSAAPTNNFEPDNLGYMMAPPSIGEPAGVWTIPFAELHSSRFAGTTILCYRTPAPTGCEQKTAWQFTMVSPASVSLIWAIERWWRCEMHRSNEAREQNRSLYELTMSSLVLPNLINFMYMVEVIRRQS